MDGALAWLGALGVLAWAWLLLLNHGFWRARETDAEPVTAPADWPAVTAVVPARDESEVIARSIGSLLAQDYPGQLKVLLVDDGSSDGTGDTARAAAAGDARLTVFAAGERPPGWTGKLWAVSQGVAAAGAAPRWLWLTDADIEHAPDTLASLVARGEKEGLVLNSLMAELSCANAAERALIPAFVFFFAMLYPFAAVNDPGSRVAGAAGGVMLVRRDALEAAGGIAAVRHAIIDDCTLGALLKRQGPIRLSLTRRSRSIRPYPDAGAIFSMIARSAYAQLGYAPLALAGALAGLSLVYFVPPALALFGEGMARWLGAAAWAMMALAFQPMLAFYRRSPLWGLALPAIAAFYAAATLASAVQHWRGRGGLWKGRYQAQVRP